jgi:hypothetical protein
MSSSSVQQPAGSNVVTGSGAVVGTKLWLTPNELSRIVDFTLSQVGQPVERIHEGAKAQFLPDVTPYAHQLYIRVRFECEDGDVTGNWLSTEAEWSRITAGTGPDDFRMGYYGCHESEATWGFDADKWNARIERDPYKIARLVSANGDKKPHWIERYLNPPEDEEADAKEDATESVERPNASEQ